MLLRVYRGTQYDALDANLLAVAPEQVIAPIDTAYWRTEATKAKTTAQSNPRKSYPVASRGAGDPDMYGWIGRGHREAYSVPASSSILKAYRDFVLERNPKLGLKSADKIAQSVINYSNYYGVDARLVMAIILCESDFRPMSTSHSGAMGLGQLMPGTASWMGVHNPYDLEENLYGMIKLLRTHMDEFHVDRYPLWSKSYLEALERVVGAYNAGEGAVRRYGGVPPYRETQAYVVKVISLFHRLSQ
jgi:soluble lytic murein transglycosylase-like protein